MISLGFVKDENIVKLKEVFKDNTKLREVHIDVYPENPLVSSSAPFMLLLRTIEMKMIVSNDGERLILQKNFDECETQFMNVLFSEIKECYCKICKYHSEFILKIQNIYYRITIFN